MKTKATSTSIAFLLMFGAFAGTAQTLTCTIQSVGSGTLGTQTFTNAAITITTAANVSAITVQPLGNTPITPTNAEYKLANPDFSPHYGKKPLFMA